VLGKNFHGGFYLFLFRQFAFQQNLYTIQDIMMLFAPVCH